MWERNDGKSESNILQNQFTAYLLTAVRRSRIQYLRIKARQYQYELALDLGDHRREFQTDPDMLDRLPVIAQLEDHRLQSALKQAKDRDLYILFSRVLEDRSFVDLAEELGIGYKAVTTIYYRMVAKIKKELGGEEK